MNLKDLSDILHEEKELLKDLELHYERTENPLLKGITREIRYSINRILHRVDNNSSITWDWKELKIAVEFDEESGEDEVA